MSGSLEECGGLEDELLTRSFPCPFRPVLTLARHPFAQPVDYAKAVEARQRLDAQKTENESVKKVRSRSLLFFLPALPIQQSR